MHSPVEINEAFFDGLEENKHANKKAKRGHGPVGKTTVMGVKDRRRPIPEVTKVRLENFVKRHVAKDTVKYTDENRVYEDPPNHESVQHSVGEFVRGQSTRTDSSLSGFC